MGSKCKCMRLSVLAFGVSLGIITGLSMLIFAWSGWLWGYGASMVEQWASLYPGFSASLKGGFLLAPSIATGVKLYNESLKLGCPIISKGCGVPRPTEITVPSNKQTDGYNKIELALGKFGEGFIGNSYIVLCV